MSAEGKSSRVRNQQAAYRESVPFDPMPSETSGQVEIQVVAVPPRGAGIAYGHDEHGNCISASGDRRTMIALFHRLREAGRTGERRRVYVERDELAQITSIERTACPIHMLPEIPDGSAVAWAPY